jgi:outer membrane protein assembly factor BamB/predicted MPP superfamily phosphohydrolase
MKHRFFVAGVVAALSFIFVSPSLSASSSNLSSENQGSAVLTSSSSSSSWSSSISSENQMYAVGGASKSLLSLQPRSSVGFLHTKVAVGADGLIKFAYLADIHVSEGTTNIADLEASVNDINKQEDIDFVIFAGDITEFGSDREISIAAEVIGRLNKPYIVLSGNHDSKWSESGCNTFAKVFGYEFFRLDIGDFVFLGCNSGPNMRMAPALVPRESILKLRELSAELSHNPSANPSAKQHEKGAPNVVFINHYPLDDAMLNWREVTTELRKMKTQLAMCGHGHNNQVLMFDGIPAVMGRSNLRANREGSGYNIVTIRPELVIDFQERTNGKTKVAWHRLRMSSNPANLEVNAQVKDNQGAVHEAQSTQNEFATPKVIFSYQDNSDIGAAAVWVKSLGRTSALSQTKGSASALSQTKGSVSALSQTKGRALAEYVSEVSGYVVFANTAGMVKCLSLADSSVVWSFDAGSKLFSSPAVADGRVVFGSSGNRIFCLNLADGRELWSYATEKSVLGSPTIFEGTVFIGASDGRFRAIGLKSGKLIWEFAGVKGFVESKPWVDRDGVYFGAWGSEFYALSTKTGKLMWTWTNGKGRGLSPAAVWPVKADGKVFIVTPERMTYALDARTGRQLWSARGGRESIGLSDRQILRNAKQASKSGNEVLNNSQVLKSGSSNSTRENPLAYKSVIYVKTMQDTLFAYATDNYLSTSTIASEALKTSSTTTSPSTTTSLSATTASSSTTPNSTTSGPMYRHDAHNSTFGNSVSATTSTTSSAPSDKKQNLGSGRPELLMVSHVGFGYEIAPTPITAAFGQIFVPTDKGDIFGLDAISGKVIWRTKVAGALINYIQPFENKTSAQNSKSKDQKSGKYLLVSTMDGKIVILEL